MRRVLGWLAGALLVMMLLMTAFAPPLAAGEVTADQPYISAATSPVPVVLNVVAIDKSPAATGHCYCEFNSLREIPEYAAAITPNTEERYMRSRRCSGERVSSHRLSGPDLFSALAGKVGTNPRC